MTKFEKILEELKDWLGEQWEDGELDALIYNIIDICENDDTETNSLYQTKEVKYDYDEFEDGETVEQVIIDNKKYIDIEYFTKIQDMIETNLKKKKEIEE